jgi:Na+/melibiose symporter-like transporter
VLSARWGKKVTWGIAVILIAAGVASAGSLVPGERSFIPLLMINTLVVFGFAAYSILVPSMLADIIDYGNWKSGIELGGMYFSVFTLMGKATIAIGGALGLFIAGAYGFDPTVHTHAVDVIFGLRFAIAWLPASILLLALVFVVLAPINARRHAIIRRRLDNRASQIQVIEKQPRRKTVDDHSADTTVLSSAKTSLISQLKI